MNHHFLTIKNMLKGSVESKVIHLPLFIVNKAGAKSIICISRCVYILYFVSIICNFCCSVNFNFTMDKYCLPLLLNLLRLLNILNVCCFSFQNILISNCTFFYFINLSIWLLNLYVC